MAIRIGPPPALARLRIYWHANYNRYLRQKKALENSVEHNPWRVISTWKRKSENALLWLNPQERTRVRNHAEFTAFVEHYEDLVDLLCRSAKEGVQLSHETKYLELREWMQRNYFKVRPRLRPYMEGVQDSLDPFEELFSPRSVDALINDTDIFHCVIQTRSVIDACPEVPSQFKGN